MSDRVGEAGLVERAGRWLLPVGAGVVTQLRIDVAFTLVIESWIDIRIETVFCYGPIGAERRFDPSASAALAPLLDRHQATVTAAEIDQCGRLTVTFADDMDLVVEPHHQYEAFTVAGTPPPGSPGFHFVAMPGGGLTRW